MTSDDAHACKAHFCPRRTPGTTLSSANRAAAPSLDFWGLAVKVAQPLGSLDGEMRNKITKLLIIVVPRRTAGDG
jgi:hypothetical protein